MIWKTKTCFKNSIEKTDIINNNTVNKQKQELAVHDFKMLEKCWNDNYDNIILNTDKWFDETDKENQNQVSQITTQKNEHDNNNNN